MPQREAKVLKRPCQNIPPKASNIGSIMTTNRKNHQNSESVARPVNVTYFEKHVLIDCLKVMLLNLDFDETQIGLTFIINKNRVSEMIQFSNHENIKILKY